jgi:hypothetical protein
MGAAVHRGATVSHIRRPRPTGCAYDLPILLDIQSWCTLSDDELCRGARRPVKEAR